MIREDSPVETTPDSTVEHIGPDALTVVDPARDATLEVIVDEATGHLTLNVMLDDGTAAGVNLDRMAQDALHMLLTHRLF